MGSFKQMLETDIVDKLDQIFRGNVDPTHSLNSFIAKAVKDGWIIEFNNRSFPGYTLKVKHTGKQRVFVTLDAVAKWMKKMGIDEFKVLQN